MAKRYPDIVNSTAALIAATTISLDSPRSRPHSTTEGHAMDRQPSAPVITEPAPRKLQGGKPAEAAGSGPYKCRFCGMTYNYSSTLHAHERVHAVETPYVCSKCGDDFAFNSELQAHMLGHVGKHTYKCKCNRSFLSYSDMVAHDCPEIPVDPEEERFQQMLKEKEEQRSNTSGGGRLLYGNRKALKGKNYMCQFCCKGFETSKQLSNHIMSHRGERVFQAGILKSEYMKNIIDTYGTASTGGHNEKLAARNGRYYSDLLDSSDED